MVKFRCGADPEVLLMDSSGKHISAIGLIGGSKDSPLQIVDMPKGYTLQEDNVTLEFGIPPAASADEFVKHIQSVMEKSKEFIPTLSFSKLSCTIFPADQMEHPSAFIFGCEPDWNAWTLEENKMPTPPHQFMRSAGGHIHVETEQDCWDVARKMDLFLSVPAVLMDKGEDRKKLYGKAGAIRKKPYGLEYRSLSNFWIFDEKTIRWAWDQTERALSSDVNILDLRESIEEAVNNNNKKVAEQLINKYNLTLV